MIGCELVWNGVGGVIVETEAYSVVNDEACPTFRRPSSRGFVADQPPGAAYVYLNYGMHWLLNFLVKGGGEDGFVLIRALDPTRGIGEMRQRRAMDDLKNLCSGPGKLTRALAIGGDDHSIDFPLLATATLLQPAEKQKVLAGPRIGITKAAHLPWRFVQKDSPFLSAPLNQ
jgi:DNA-3-methyladenine glycosylase